MSKVSLYDIFLSVFRFMLNGKTKNTGVDEGGTPCPLKRISLRRKASFLHMLSCCIVESSQSVISSSWKTNGDELCKGKCLGKTFQIRKHGRFENPFWTRSEIYNGLFGQRCRTPCDRAGQTERAQALVAWEWASGKETNDSRFKRFLSALAQDISEQENFQGESPRRNSTNTRPRSCKNVNVKHLKDTSSSIMLVRATLVLKDMSLAVGSCGGGDIYIPSRRVTRLNIFEIIDRDNRYKSLTTLKVIGFLDEVSFNLGTDTFVILDNASVHRNKLIRELRLIWKRKGLVLFYLPQYLPQLNIAETLWRILKGKWIRLQDYITSDMLFYTTNMTLADIEKGLCINFSQTVA